MNISLFIARRIANSSTRGYSGKIIKLAIASITVSIAVMILSTAIIIGFKHEISEKIFGFWGHIHITDTQINRSFELNPIINDIAITDSVLTIGSLSYRQVFRDGSVEEGVTKGGVKSITPFVTLPAIINKTNDLEGIILKGVDPNYDWNAFESYIIKGAGPTIEDSVTSTQILISDQTAQRLVLDIGDRIVLNFVQDRNSIKRRVEVCGIYKTGLETYDRRFAFVDLKLLQGVMGWGPDQIGGYEIFVEHIPDALPIADYIYEEILPPHLYAETIQEKFSNEFEWLELQNINEALLIMLMIIVAIINMSTALLILILERSRMIGILKSLGQPDWDIRKIFIYNAVWILLIAIFFGNVLGLGIAALQKYTGFIKLDEANYYLSEVPIKFDFLSIMSINVGAVLIVALVMILPTYLVTRVSPIKILRFQ